MACYRELACWDYSIHIFNIDFLQNLKTEGCKLSYKLNIVPPAWLLDAVGIVIDTCLILFTIDK